MDHAKKMMHGGKVHYKPGGGMVKDKKMMMDDKMKMSKYYKDGGTVITGRD